MQQRSRAFWIIVTVLAVAIVIGLLFSRGVFDTSKKSEQPISVPLDETGQSPRVHTHPQKTNGAGTTEATPKTEKAPRTTDQESGTDLENQQRDGNAEDSDPLNVAQRYDVDGQVGEPPEGWKSDYTHWDAFFDLESVGIIRPNGGTVRTYTPTEETRKRVDAIEKELNDALEKGLISMGEPIKGYVKRVIDDEGVAYVAKSFIERFDTLAAEDKALHESSMVERTAELHEMFNHSPSITYDTNFSGINNFRIHYYRKSDGTLMRKVTVKGGKAEQFVASPPPNLEALGFSPKAIEVQKGVWNRSNHSNRQ